MYIIYKQLITRVFLDIPAVEVRTNYTGRHPDTLLEQSLMTPLPCYNKSLSDPSGTGILCYTSISHDRKSFKTVFLKGVKWKTAGDIYIGTR